MAQKFKSGMQLDANGFGLPRLTTAQRLLKFPTTEGYIVFDTDLKTPFTWVDGIWDAIVVGDKVDTVSGEMTGSLAVESSTNGTSLNVNSGGAEVTIELENGPGLSAAGSRYTSWANPIAYENDFWSGVNGIVGYRKSISTTTKPYSRVSILQWGVGSASQISGKWYWETRMYDRGWNYYRQGTWGAGIRIYTPSGSSVPGKEGVYFYFGPSHFGDDNQTANISTSISVGALGPNPSTRYTMGSIVYEDPSVSFFVTDNVVRHRLDLDNGKYEIALADGSWQTVASDFDTELGPIMPVVYARDNTTTKIIFAGADMQYDIPPGYYTYDGIGSGGSTILSDDAIVMGKQNGATINFATDSITASTHMTGVDSDIPESLIIKNVADTYVSSLKHSQLFDLTDWVTSGDRSEIIILASEHLLPVDVTPLSYTVTVYELINNDFNEVSIEYSIDNTTGDVTIATNGAVFAGIVNIIYK